MYGIYTSELILCSTICVPSATRHNIHMYPYFLFAAIHHLKSSPTFSVRPCSSVGRVTEDLIRRSWVRFPPRSKDFFLPRVVPCFPLLGLTPSGLFMGLSSTIIYTSELILCSTICMEAPGFKGFPIQVIQHIYRPNIVWRACNNPSCTILNFLQLIFQLLTTFIQQGLSSSQNKVQLMISRYKVTRVQRGTKGLILLKASMPAHAFLHI